MKARGAQIPIWSNKELGIDEKQVGLNGSPTQVIKIFTPPQKPGGKIFSGEPKEVVDKLFEEIKDIL